MAITLSCGIQKGGVGKTTTTGMMSWLLAQNARVLAVDFDSQGNLTQLLTGIDDLSQFNGRTVYEACKAKDPRPYIHRISESLHLLPANDFLSGFARYLFGEYKEQCQRDGTLAREPSVLSTLLKDTLASVKEDYDFITIDLPPNLGEQTLNGICACDHCIVVFQAEPLCRNALVNYLEFLIACQREVDENIHVLGILTSIIDVRTSLGKAILAETREDYGDLVFDTLIRRKAKIAEFSVTGIRNRTKEEREALSMYQDFVKELIERVQSGSNSRAVES